MGLHCLDYSIAFRFCYLVLMVTVAALIFESLESERCKLEFPPLL